MDNAIRRRIMKVKDKRELLKNYVEIRDQIIKTLEKSDYEIDIDGDVVDLLQGQNLVNIQNQLSINNLKMLRVLNSAIEMLNNGDYGKCEECGESISIKRLEVLPGTTTCVFCAELSERNR
jgi:DnaK suppressor protein